MKQRKVSDERVQKCLAFLVFVKDKLNTKGLKALSNLPKEHGWTSGGRIISLLKIDHMIVQRGNTWHWDTIDEPTPIMARKLCRQDNRRWQEQLKARNAAKQPAPIKPAKFKFDKPERIEVDQVSTELYKKVVQEKFDLNSDYLKLEAQAGTVQSELTETKQILVTLEEEALALAQGGKLWEKKAHEAVENYAELKRIIQNDDQKSRRDVMNKLSKLTDIVISNETAPKPKRKSRMVLSITIFGYELALVGINRNS